MKLLTSSVPLLLLVANTISFVQAKIDHERGLALDSSSGVLGTRGLKGASSNQRRRLVEKKCKKKKEEKKKSKKETDKSKKSSPKDPPKDPKSASSKSLAADPPKSASSKSEPKDPKRALRKVTEKPADAATPIKGGPRSHSHRRRLQDSVEESQSQESPSSDEDECLEWASYRESVRSACPAADEEKPEDILVVPFQYQLQPEVASVVESEQIDAIETAIHESIVEQELSCGDAVQTPPDSDGALRRRRVQDSLLVVGADPTPIDVPSETATCVSDAEGCVVMDGFVTLVLEGDLALASADEIGVIVQSTQNIIKAAMNNGNFDIQPADGVVGITAKYVDPIDEGSQETGQQGSEEEKEEDPEEDPEPMGESSSRESTPPTEPAIMAPLAIIPILIILLGVAYWYHKKNSAAEQQRVIAEDDESVAKDGEDKAGDGSVTTEEHTMSSGENVPEAEIVIGSSNDETMYTDSMPMKAEAYVVEDINTMEKKKKLGEL